MFDLRTYLTRYAKVAARHNDDREWVISCACDRRDSTREPHLWVSVDKQVGFCFRCRARYTLVDVIRLVEGCSLLEAYALLQAGESPRSRLQDVLDGLTPSEDVEDSEAPILVKLPEEYEPIQCETDRPKYLRERGVSLKLCRVHRIGVCRTGFYRQRVIVPVYDLDGELALFVARWMGVPPKGGKKVLYPKGSRASHVLFNHQRAAACSTVVITEGVFDAMRVGRSAVCLFGKHASQTQISLLVELGLTRRLVVMLDPDASDDAEALAESLVEVCPDVRIATLPEGRKDPGEATRDEIRRSVRSARSIGVGGQLGSVLAGL